MGKTLPPFSSLIEQERRRWVPFKKALPKPIKPASIGSLIAPNCTSKLGSWSPGHGPLRPS
jgi:hypothetical protein